MDSRDLFRFRFVDRFDSTEEMIHFISTPSDGKVLWLYGGRGTGKTRLIEQVLSEHLGAEQRAVIYSFDASPEGSELQQFLEQLQEAVSIRFLEFLRANYTSLLDISKQVTTQLLKNVGFDMGGFVSAAYDGAKLFVAKGTQQQHSAVKVIGQYLAFILQQHSLVIALDHFSLCKKQSVDLFMQLIGQFVDDPDVHFVVCTTDEELCDREDIQTKLLTKVAVIRLEVKPFNEDIYFYEILDDIFSIPQSERDTIAQVFSICNGLPVKLQLALMELYRTNAIQISGNKAQLDFVEMKRYLLQKEVGFKLNAYSISAKILLRLVVALNECATPQLLKHAAEYIIRKLFCGMELMIQDLDGDLKALCQGNVININIAQKGAVKIGNPFVREALKEQFASDSVKRLFSGALVSYFSDEASFIASLDLAPDWKARVVVTHAINGQTPGWVQTALEYGLQQYSKGFITDATEVFIQIQQENNEIASEDLLKMADCFYLAGNYNLSESLMQIVEGRQDLDNWAFHFCYSKTLNLLLKKNRAAQEAQMAVSQAKTAEERIRALNMQQQILVDTTGGKAEAKQIFLSLTKQLKKTSEVGPYVLPALKTVVDFYHGTDSFKCLRKAKELATADDNQLELAFILTNEGFERFRQGQGKEAEQCFVDALKLLENTRLHEISYPLCNLANCYMAQGMYERAVSVLLRAALWNQSSYVFVTIQTLLMVCYAFLKQDEKSRQTANDLVTYIESYKITDTTMLRKIYLNMALTYRHLKEMELEETYARKAYPISQHTSSWYRAYEVAQPFMQNLSSPIQYCPRGEEWYWTNGDYEPWLVTFSHD